MTNDLAEESLETLCVPQADIVSCQSSEYYIPAVLSLLYGDISEWDLKNLVTVFAAFTSVSKAALARKGQKKKMLIGDDIRARGYAVRTLSYAVFGVDHHHHEEFDRRITALSERLYNYPYPSIRSNRWRQVKPFDCRVTSGGILVRVSACVFQAFFSHTAGIEKIDLPLVQEMKSRYTIRAYLILQSWRKSFFSVNYVSLHRMFCTDDQLHNYKSFVSDLRRARRELKEYFDAGRLSYYFDYKTADFIFTDSGICRPEKVLFMKYWSVETLTPSSRYRYNRRLKILGGKIESSFHIPAGIVFDWMQKVEPNTLVPVEELVECCVKKLKRGDIFPVSNYMRKGLERIFSQSDWGRHPNDSGTPKSRNP